MSTPGTRRIGAVALPAADGANRGSQRVDQRAPVPEGAPLAGRTSAWPCCPRDRTRRSDEAVPQPRRRRRPHRDDRARAGHRFPGSERLGQDHHDALHPRPDPTDRRDGDGPGTALPGARPTDAPGRRPDRPPRAAPRSHRLRPPPGPGAEQRPPAAAGRRGHRDGRPGVGRPRAGPGLLPRHGAAPGHRHRTAGRPRRAAPRRAGQRAGPPEGIRWVRELLRGLAGEGRTVLVSSHLMSEMEDTADHLVVLGHGRLLADLPMADLLGQHSAVRVRSPMASLLARALERAGARVDVLADGALWVEGMDVVEVGDVAFLSGLRVHELTQVNESLEEAYLALTEDEVEFRAVPA